MAMGKNKTGIMAAITAAAEASNASKSAGTDRAHRTLPKGTIGSVRAGFGGIQEIDTKMVLAWGPKDRLDIELTDVNNGDVPESVRELADSIKEAGQQVPVLLRPSSERDGFFEVVYGQRRILACRYLGVPVRALIRTLDNTAALMAKGLENAGRAELSFYERARFAQAILDQDYSRAEVCQALAISKNSLSQLERVNRLIPPAVGEAIGAAPSAGRPKWMGVATVFEKGLISELDAMSIIANCEGDSTSDDRLDFLVREMNKQNRPKDTVLERSPVADVSIKTSKSGLLVSAKRTKGSEQFVNWLDQNIDQMMKDALKRFQSDSADG